MTVDSLTPDDVRKTIPPEIAEARKADTGRTLYADQERDTIAESIVMDGMENMQPETVAAWRTEYANMAIDAGATQADVSVLHSALVAARSSPLTDEARAAARAECVTAFNRTYGQEAYKTLEITRAWIQQDLRRNVLFSQVGDDPQIALLAARLALAAQRRR